MKCMIFTITRITAVLYIKVPLKNNANPKPIASPGIARVIIYSPWVIFLKNPPPPFERTYIYPEINDKTVPRTPDINAIDTDDHINGVILPVLNIRVK